MRKGIGGALIRATYQKAESLGFRSVILIGHATYYPRFGYRPASEYNITLPFEVPKENAMALELVKGSLAATRGMVQYPTAFFH
jgi:predicted N-acetyltransferase YhbS